MYTSNGFITILRGWKDDPDFDDKVPDNRPRTNSIPASITSATRTRSSGATDSVESTVRYVTVLLPIYVDIWKDDRFKDDNTGDFFRVTDVDAFTSRWLGHKVVTARLDSSASF